MRRPRNPAVQPQRPAQSGTALAVSLFLLSILALVPLMWMSLRRRENLASAPDEYEIRQPGNGDSGRDIAQDLEIRDWHQVDGLDGELAQFESVFWEPNDTDSLRSWLADQTSLNGADVLEIGTGTGLIALWCAVHGAQSVTATDINPAAVANAAYNAERMQLSSKITVHQVAPETPGPFEVIDTGARFDFIISNPPWEDAAVSEPASHALYDPQFALLDAILSEAASRLKPQGKLLLAYGATEAIQRILDSAPKHGWRVSLADERQLAKLPDVFLPGMLIVLSPEQ